MKEEVLQSISYILYHSVEKKTKKRDLKLGGKSSNSSLPKSKRNLILHDNNKQNRASLAAQTVKHSPAMQETRVQSLGRDDPEEETMATHSSILTWRIAQTEEPDGLQSMGCKESDRTEWLTQPKKYDCSWILDEVIIFFSFIFISWRLIILQYCSGFCHTLTWISHGVTWKLSFFKKRIIACQKDMPTKYIRKESNISKWAKRNNKDGIKLQKIWKKILTQNFSDSDMRLFRKI